MINIVFELDGVVEFDRSFSRFGANLTDFRQIWPGVIEELRLITKEQFSGQGVGLTGPWKALSPRYKKWKEKKYPGQPILVRTGEMREALTTNTEKSIVRQGKDTLEFGVALPYPIHHQRGGKRLPQRKIFDLTEAHKLRLVKVIQRRLVAAGRNNGVTLK